MKLLKKIFTSDIAKILTIVLVGFIVATFLQNATKTTINNVTTKETLHEDDSASLRLIDFEKQAKKEKTQYEIDFTSKGSEVKELDLEFNSYNLTDEKLLDREMFDVKKYNFLFVGFIIIILSVILFKSKDDKRGV